MSLSLHDVALFLHIAAAIHLLGTAVASPMVVAHIQSASSRPELLSWLGFLRRLTRGNPATAFVLLASGIYLGAAGWWSSGWFYVSLVAWVMSSALAGAVLKPTAQRIAQAAASNPAAPIDASLDQIRHARGWTLAEKAMLGSDIAMLWIMIAKPSLAVSAALFVGSVAIAVLLKATLARRTPVAAVSH